MSNTPKSKLHYLVSRLKGKGIVMDAAAPPTIAIFWSVAVSGFGTLICTSIILDWINPDAAFFVPRCPGNPYAGLIMGSIMAALGIGGVVLARCIPSGLYLNDECLVLRYHSQRAVLINWHTMNRALRVGDSLFILFANGLRPYVIGSLPEKANSNLHLLFSFLQMRQLDLTSSQPFMSVAFDQLRKRILTDGLVFPIRNFQVEHTANQAFNIIVWGGTIATVFAGIGWFTSAGPAIGLAVVVVCCVAMFGFQKRGIAADEVRLLKDQLQISRFGMALAPISMDRVSDIRPFRDGYRVFSFKKGDGTSLLIDSRSAVLIADFAKMLASPASKLARDHATEMP
jgi:hypothetical protein